MQRSLLIYIAQHSPMHLTPRDMRLIDRQSWEVFKSNGWIVTTMSSDGFVLARITPDGMRQAADWMEQMNDELTRDPDFDEYEFH